MIYKTLGTVMNLKHKKFHNEVVYNIFYFHNGKIIFKMALCLQFKEKFTQFSGYVHIPLEKIKIYRNNA